MVDVKEKLFELVGQTQDCGCDVTNVVTMNYVENTVLVDYLLTNGVTIPVRCENCTRGDPTDAPRGRVWCTKICRYMRLDGFCSYGDRKEVV